MALRAGLRTAGEGLGLSVSEILAQTSRIVLGTTVATNALLTRRGGRTGLLVTKGHEDSLEIREGHREDGHRYDWTYPPAQPLVPRSLRLPIDERIIYDGSVLRPLSEHDVDTALEELAQRNVEAIGVSFMWSHLNTMHERRVAEIARRRLPGAYVCASHEILPVMGEYNRVSTVAANAFVGPVVRRFVEEMENTLVDLGFEGSIRYLQGSGGIASGDTIVRRAIYAVNSGPAAGPSAGAHFAGLYGRDVITGDLGGTSFDVGLVHAGEIDVRLTSDVARYRIGVPLVNVETLGAGGGSIARLDERGLLAVGPDSAEARPGPAAYGFGGVEPTVTDALVITGWLSRESLLGGRMKIDSMAAKRAVQEQIAGPLGISVEEAAFGILRVAAESMVGGIRRISIERGYDPRQAVFVAVGGAGPAFACRIAADLGISTIVVPLVASGFCAFGAVVADLKHDYVAAFTTPLLDADTALLSRTLADLEAHGLRELSVDKASGITLGVETRWSFELRYADQLHNCLVRFPRLEQLNHETLAQIRAAFDAKHEELYAYCEPDNEVVLVSVHCSVIGRSLDPGSAHKLRSASLFAGGALGTEHRSVYLDNDAAYVDIPVLTPDHFVDEKLVDGPLIVSEATTTIAVERGWAIRLDQRGFYELLAA